MYWALVVEDVFINGKVGHYFRHIFVDTLRLLQSSLLSLIFCRDYLAVRYIGPNSINLAYRYTARFHASRVISEHCRLCCTVVNCRFTHTHTRIQQSRCTAVTAECTPTDSAQSVYSQSQPAGPQFDSHSNTPLTLTPALQAKNNQNTH